MAAGATRGGGGGRGSQHARQQQRRCVRVRGPGQVVLLLLCCVAVPGVTAVTHCCAAAGLSALDKSKTDRQILDWAGVYKGYATGLRDEPLQED